MVSKRHLLLFLGSILLLGMIFVWSIGYGSVSVNAQKIFLSIMDPSQLSLTEKDILWNIRVPRALLAIAIGAGLSVSGALLQAVMQNPMVDPGIIGISSGASFFILLILLVLPIYAPLLPLIAFVGSITTTFLIYLLSWKDGIRTLSLLLSGIAMNAMLGGASGILQVLNSEKLQSVILWINGTLAGRSWQELRIVFPYMSITLFLSFFCIRSANILSLGDEKATNLGVNTHKARILLSIIAALLAAIATSSVGVIGFIGLVVPHISRLLVGSDYKVLLPFSLINGSSFLLLADTLARLIVQPVELPVGTIMAVVGGPFFLYLLRKRRSL